MRAILCCIVSIGLAGCNRQSQQQEAPAPLTVLAALPVAEKVTDYAEYPGRTAAIDAVEVRARVGGYLDKINFKEGTLVKKGDVLFEIDPRPFQALVNFSRAQLAANEALLRKAVADNVRNQQIAKTPGAVSQAELDQTRAAEDQARANVETAKATLNTNQLNLNFTKVTSPIDGRISKFNITIGNLVKQDDTLLTTIVSVNPIYVYFDVDENTVLLVRKLISEGKAKSARDITYNVFVRLANETTFPHRATVNFVDNQVNPKTGTLRIRAVMSNDDELISPGFYARVRVPIGFPHDALLIVDRAIDTDQNQRIVYVIDSESKIAIKPVKTGALHDGMRAIEAGLAADDRVVVSGLQQIRPGIAVTPKMIEMPRAAVQTQTPSSGP